jgi:LysM repeat protein
VPASSPAAPSDRRTLQRVEAGFDLLDRNQPVEGRLVLSQALLSGRLGSSDAAKVRDRLTALNDEMIFGPVVAPDDPFALTYTVQKNDVLSAIPRAMGVQTDWRFIQRINGIASPRSIRVGQRLKLITGPFHAVVHKDEFRMDVFLGDGSERVYVRSFPVGLGKLDGTPEGRFIVRPQSKLINPEWRNPRTRELFLPDDPNNPIGEHWLGLMPDEDRIANAEGYGIHGTIDLPSVGTQSSLGCIRMYPDDVALVWEMLMEGVSVVEIVE